MESKVIRRTALGALLAIAAIIATACGGSGEKKAAVEDQLGFTPEGKEQRQTRVENGIATCMRTQGFEYVPVDPKVRRAALVGNASLSGADYEKQFGYGITTLFEQKRKLAVGPNEAIRSRLSATDGKAYDQALVGEKGGTFLQAMDTGDFSQLDGCTRKATEEAFGGATVLQSLQAKLAELDQRIENDPRFLAAVQKWSGCMREAGFDVARPKDVDSTLRQRLEAIVGREAASGASREANLTYDRAALAALQRQEVQMVAADLRCEQKYIVDVEDTIRPEYEGPFREQNAALFDQVPKP